MQDEQAGPTFEDVSDRLAAHEAATRRSPQMSGEAAKPWIEIRHKLGPGHYCTYASAYKHPLRVWVLGRWIIGRP